MNSKIGVLTVAYNAEDFIKANVKQFKNKNLLHVVVNGQQPWRGKAKRDDKTGDIALANGATVIYSVEQTTDSQQRNIGLQVLANNGIEWAIIADSDEFWEKKELNKLIADIEREWDDADIIAAPNMHVYWMDWNHLILPDPQPDKPIVAIKTNKKFSWSRLCNEGRRVNTDAEFYHLSYVRSDEDMLQKIAGSEHKREWIPDWYERVWLKWTETDTNLHPVVPHQFSETIYKPIPKEIGELF